MVVDSDELADVTLEQRLHLSVEHKNHEAPVSAQKVRPKFIIDLFDINSIVWTLNIRLLLTYIQFFMKCIRQYVQKFM